MEDYLPPAFSSPCSRISAYWFPNDWSLYKISTFLLNSQTIIFRRTCLNLPHLQAVLNLKVELRRSWNFKFFHRNSKYKFNPLQVSPWLTEGDVFISERRKKRRLFMRSASPSIYLSDAHLKLTLTSASAFFLSYSLWHSCKSKSLAPSRP